MMNSETGGKLMLRSIGCAAVIAAMVSGPLLASDTRQLVPEQVGFSSRRLERIDKVLGDFVADGKLGGAVTLISRRGAVVHHAAIGRLNEQQPMRDDAVFAIASMTKPITSVAVLMLYEEGHFILDDPVAEFLPEFKNLEVWDRSTQTDGAPSTVPLAREMTIRDLLRHTSGLAYEADGAVGVMIERLLDGPDEPNASFVAKLAAIPLVHQPGTTWEYGSSTDVLGHLVEVISGQPLGVFLSERLFSPLGMVDTGFYVPASKRSRFAGLFVADEDGPVRHVRRPVDDAYESAPQGPSGGGGLVSTAADYGRFLQMILNGGTLEGRRYLSRTTVEMMTTDHCKGLDGLRPGQGFGLGFRVRTGLGETGVPGSLGAISWAGIYNTFFWIDPREELIGILMTQTSPYGHLSLRERFKSLVYQAIID